MVSPVSWSKIETRLGLFLIVFNLSYQRLYLLSDDLSNIFVDILFDILLDILLPASPMFYAALGGTGWVRF